jgi:hypothetical protein
MVTKVEAYFLRINELFINQVELLLNSIVEFQNDLSSYLEAHTTIQYAIFKGSFGVKKPSILSSSIGDQSIPAWEDGDFWRSIEGKKAIEILETFKDFCYEFIQIKKKETSDKKKEPSKESMSNSSRSKHIALSDEEQDEDDEKEEEDEEEGNVMVVSNEVEEEELKNAGSKKQKTKKRNFDRSSFELEEEEEEETDGMAMDDGCEEVENNFSNNEDIDEDDEEIEVVQEDEGEEDTEMTDDGNKWVEVINRFPPVISGSGLKEFLHTNEFFGELINPYFKVKAKPLARIFKNERACKSIHHQYAIAIKLAVRYLYNNLKIFCFH